MLSELDNAYYERNKLVRFLASIYPSGIARTNIPDWDPEWQNCVYIDTPAGQMSWHYHDREAHLFQSLPPYTKEWDGHTTQEKYLRLEELTYRAAQPTPPPFYQAQSQEHETGEATERVHPAAPPVPERVSDLPGVPTQSLNAGSSQAWP